MTNLSKEDLLQMIKSGDTTPLVLHWEGTGDDFDTGDAKGILQSVKDQIDADHPEKSLWKMAYICSQEDYDAEQQEESLSKAKEFLNLIEAERIDFECIECGKKFKSSNTNEPKCPKCGGYDVEPL